MEQCQIRGKNNAKRIFFQEKGLTATHNKTMIYFSFRSLFERQFKIVLIKPLDMLEGPVNSAL